VVEPTPIPDLLDHISRSDLGEIPVGDGGRGVAELCGDGRQRLPLMCERCGQ
jgi:hypothetical protein